MTKDSARRGKIVSKSFVKLVREIFEEEFHSQEG